MASITQDKSGWRLLFRDARGKRQAVRLGTIPKRVAEGIKLRVEDILAAQHAAVAMDAESARWIRDISDDLHEKLARTGLFPPRTESHPTLGLLLQRFEETSTVKPSTMLAYKQAMRSLEESFGAETLLTSIHPYHADQWFKRSLDQGLREATVAKRTKIAKSIFGRAIRWKMIEDSPFQDLKPGSQVNSTRLRYVTKDETTAVLAACPDDRWRLIIGLARYAGLRCPSEIVALRWSDILWDTPPRMHVRSPKTEHHAGKGERVVPIVAELEELLNRAFAAAEPGDNAVISRGIDSKTNLRTTFEKIIRRAGLTPWPRLFQNLRASCEMDFVEKVPGDTAAKWMGHSTSIAGRHYLAVRDAHFEAVTGRANAAQLAKGVALPADLSSPNRPVERRVAQ